MGTRPDYYEILQVSPNADAEVIDAAYRRLALRWHPDRNPGDSDAAARMKLLNDAYAVLSDAVKRRAYDLQRNRSGTDGQIKEDPAPTPAPETHHGTGAGPRPASEAKNGETPPHPPLDHSSASVPDQKEKVSPFARALTTLGVFLFVMAHGLDLFTQTLVFLLGCLCWGTAFGLPAYLCIRSGQRTGVSVVAAVFFLAAVLDVGSRLSKWSDDPVQTEALQTQREMERSPGDSPGPVREEEPLPDVVDLFGPPASEAPADVNKQPNKPEADERRVRNKKRVREIATAIEALDPVIPLWAQANWRSETNAYRLGKQPGEAARDSLFELLVKMEMSEQARIRSIERAVASLGITVRTYCLTNGYPLPQDHKSGDWKRLRETLAELEY